MLERKVCTCWGGSTKWVYSLTPLSSAPTRTKTTIFFLLHAHPASLLVTRTSPRAFSTDTRAKCYTGSSKQEVAPRRPLSKWPIRMKLGRRVSFFVDPCWITKKSFLENLTLANGRKTSSTAGVPLSLLILHFFTVVMLMINISISLKENRNCKQVVFFFCLFLFSDCYEQAYPNRPPDRRGRVDAFCFCVSATRCCPSGCRAMCKVWTFSRFPLKIFAAGGALQVEVAFWLALGGEGAPYWNERVHSQKLGSFFIKGHPQSVAGMYFCISKIPKWSADIHSDPLWLITQKCCFFRKWKQSICGVGSVWRATLPFFFSGWFMLVP